LFDSNLLSQDSGDLSFRAGDIIEIVEETNADWWTGRVNGKEALFPSSYVERIETPAAAPTPPAPTPVAGRTLPPAFTGAKEKPAYKPFGAAHQSANAPPPPGVGVNSSGLQQDPGEEAKKSKFGKYGNTMAHSAAGGVYSCSSSCCVISFCYFRCWFRCRCCYRWWFSQGYIL